MEAKTINVGDRVQFTARGQTITGTVVNYKFSRPGSRSALVKAYDLSTYIVRKLEVRPDSGEGLWTVNERVCTRLGVSDNTSVAMREASELKAKVRHAKSERRFERIDTANNAGFYDLKRGDIIEVQFRDAGWVKVRFDHVAASGRIAYYREGEGQVRPNIEYMLGMATKPKVRSTPPQFARLVNAETK